MTHTILCVEDNPENQTLVRRILESRGYRVVVAGDGLSGVQLAQEIEPDLILMDMNLPGIDGHAATTRIKSIPKLRNIPVVALTANALSGDRERTLAAGCDGYLSKPFKLHELIASVGEFLTGKRERIQPSEKLGYVEQYASRLVVELESQVKALQKANEELRTLDRLKDEFVSTVSHELRTPLNIILGHAEVLEDEIFGELNPQQRRYVSNIVGSAHHLSELVQDILDLSRIESGQFSLRPQWFTLAPVLDELRTLLEPLAQSKGIALGLEVPPAMGQVYADRLRFKQVIHNLMSNALKFTPADGTVHCSMTCQGPDTLRIEVRDTGIGIAPEHQELIFERFRQVDASASREGEGTGLGLALTREFVRLHGGSVSVQSEPGHGSTFTVLLPQPGHAPMRGEPNVRQEPPAPIARMG